MDSEVSGARPVYWIGAARLFDGKEAKARETPVAIGPAGLEIREGIAGGHYGPGDLALLECNEDSSFFSLELKPHPDHVLTFQDPQAMEWLRSSGLLKRPAFFGLSLAWKAAALLVFLTAFSAFMYLVGIDLMVSATLKVLPAKADRLLGDAVIKGFTEHQTTPKDTMALRALEKSRAMVQGLDAGSRDSIRILVVADSSIKNAFAFPGGYIVVYTGMLRLLETPEEWAGLLAHEGGHIHLRHGMRGIVRSSLIAVGASLIFGDVSGIGSVLMDNAGTLVNLSYGRQDESEADAFAQSRLRARGYSAEGLPSLFEKILKLQHMPSWAAFLSTHPATEDRIDRLRVVRHAEPKGILLTREEWEALRKL